MLVQINSTKICDGVQTAHAWLDCADKTHLSFPLWPGVEPSPGQHADSQARGLYFIKRGWFVGSSLVPSNCHNFFTLLVNIIIQDSYRNTIKMNNFNSRKVFRPKGSGLSESWPLIPGAIWKDKIILLFSPVKLAQISANDMKLRSVLGDLSNYLRQIFFVDNLRIYCLTGLSFDFLMR